MICKCNKSKCVCRNNYELALLEGRAVGMTLSQYLDSLEGTDGNQGPQGIMGLQGPPGENGGVAISTFTSYVFKRSDTVPDTPIGGSFDVPYPSDSSWSDSPVGGSGTLYVSSRMFTSNGNPPQSDTWSEPVVAADSESIDFSWSSLDFNPGTPDTHPQNWVDEADETTVWMALRKKTNGIWGNWNIIRIKGENGETGEPGNTIEFRYQKNGSFTVPPDLDPLARNPVGWSTTRPTIVTGEYVWQIQAIINQVTNVLVGSWASPIRVTGERGENGDQGPSAIFRGDWKSTEQYNGNNIGVDIVKYIPNGKGYIARVDAGVIPIGTVPTNTTYWNEVPVNIDALFTDFLFAYSAYIQDLTVGSLKTEISGTRVEIEQAENKFKFYQDTNLDPSVEIGLVQVPETSTIAVSQPTVLGGLKLGNSNNNHLTERGLYLANVFGNAFYRTLDGSTYAVQKAGIVSLNPNVVINPREGGQTSLFGTVTNSFYLYKSGGTEDAQGMFVGYNATTKKPYKGYTGTINGAVFIDGICVGPE